LNKPVVPGNKILVLC